MKKIVLKLYGFKCCRCSHSWIPRKKEVRICPKCKSPYWDRPRKKIKEYKSNIQLGNINEST